MSDTIEPKYESLLKSIHQVQIDLAALKQRVDRLESDVKPINHIAAKVDSIDQKVTIHLENLENNHKILTQLVTKGLNRDENSNCNGIKKEYQYWRDRFFQIVTNLLMLILGGIVTMFFRGLI